MTESQDEQTVRDRIARQFIGALPFARALGMELDRLGDDEAQISMGWNENFVATAAGRPWRRDLGADGHMQRRGGAVSRHGTEIHGDDRPAHRLYARRDADGITAHHCYRDHSVAFVRAQAFDEDSANPVATATGSLHGGALRWRTATNRFSRSRTAATMR